MVFLFSDSQGPEQEEISEILCRHGAGIVSDREAPVQNQTFLLASAHTPIKLEAESGIVIFTSDCAAFRDQRLPGSLSGVCESDNKTALEILQQNKNPVITCGMDLRNALTLSGVWEYAVSVGLQRTLRDKNGTELSPAEYPICLTKPYTPFAVLAATAALLTEGIVPVRF